MPCFERGYTLIFAYILLRLFSLLLLIYISIIVCAARSYTHNYNKLFAFVLAMRQMRARTLVLHNSRRISNKPQRRSSRARARSLCAPHHHHHPRLNDMDTRALVESDDRLLFARLMAKSTRHSRLALYISINICAHCCCRGGVAGWFVGWMRRVV